jgi:hypothetical protein
MFATARDRTSGVPVHIHSLARSQTAGNLGDLLKAMRAGFAEAGGTGKPVDPVHR